MDRENYLRRSFIFYFLQINNKKFYLKYMQKYIKLYEDFKDLQSNVTGNWNQIRDMIQSMKPF